MKKLLTVIVTLVLIVASGWVLEIGAQRNARDLINRINVVSPLGRARVDVEYELELSGLEHVYGPSDNAIYGRKVVGRYRLIYSTELIYRIQFDENGRVAQVETNTFNGGL